MGRRGAVRALLGLLALLLLHVALSARWTRANGAFVRPPLAEAAHYRLKAARLLVVLEDDGPGAWLARAYGEPDSHTPLLALVASACGALSGRGLDPGVLWATMMVFALALAVGAYGLARAFVGPGAALAVAALTLAAPVVQGYQRDFFPTLPVAAFSVLALAALLRTDAFGRRRASLVFGVLSGCAVLAKVLAPLYLVGACAWELGRGLRRHGRRALANAGWSAAAAAGLVLPWLVANVDRLVGYTGIVVGQEGIAAGDEGALRRWTYYPLAAAVWGLGVPAAAVVALGALGPMRDPAAWRHGAPLVAAVVVSWIVLTLGQTATEAQYVVVWVPLAFLLLVAGIARAPVRARRVLASLAVAAWLLNVALAQRSIAHDVPVVALWRDPPPVLPALPARFGRIVHQQGVPALVPNTGQYLGPLLRVFEVECRPDGEPWPVAAFTERVLADAAPRVPCVSETHAVITPNMEVEAVLRRRLLERARLPVRLRAAHPADFAVVDYFVSDSLLYGDDPWIAVAERAGIRVETLERVRVTAGSEVRLYALRKPWERAPTAAWSSLDRPGVERRDGPALLGWRVVGLEVEPREELGGAPVVHAFVEPFGASPAPGVRVVLRQSPDAAPAGARRLPPSDGGGPLVVVSFAGPELGVAPPRFEVALESPGPTPPR